MKIIHTHRHARHATTLHLPGCPIPCYEIPARAEAIVQALDDAGLRDRTEPADFGLEPIAAIHDGDFLRYLQSAYSSSRPYFEAEKPAIAETYCGRGWRHKPLGWPGQIGFYSFDATAPILDGTWEAAYWSAQCAATAADLVLKGEPFAYALCRPPGHHASRDMHGGFCYLNNAAIAASILVRSTAQRVAVLDIDYHHGNGTQEIFYSSPDVLYCSLHADPDHDYPFFWGGRQERGEGRGAGTNYNWPLPPRVSQRDYLTALAEAISILEGFNPSFLVLSAGFDFMETDPAPLAGGAFLVGLSGLDLMARMVGALSLPTVIVQEGGYDIERIGIYVVHFLKQFAQAARKTTSRA